MKQKKNNKTILLVSILVVLLIAVAIPVFMYTQSLNSVNQSKTDVVFTVSKGENAKEVLKNLKSEKLIKDDFFANVYLKLNKVDSFKVGQYVLNDSMDVKTILSTISNAKLALSDDVKVTIPEGTWAKEIANKISTVTGISADELIALWNDETYLKELIDVYPFLTEDILNDKLRIKLEGYLFPETYYFAKDSSAKDVTKRLLDQTNKIYTKYEAEFKASEYSIHDLFTLASITQFESGKSEDNKIISGVWYNRLDQNMPLQSSVTVCYALYDYSHWRDCEVNPDIESPFNTYKYSGIPIGPIANPGEDAIVSVLKPEKTDYLYFIADVYGDGTVYYAKTYQEHLANVNKYLK